MTPVFAQGMLVGIGVGVLWTLIVVYLVERIRASKDRENGK